MTRNRYRHCQNLSILQTLLCPCWVNFPSCITWQTDKVSPRCQVQSPGSQEVFIVLHWFLLKSGEIPRIPVESILAQGPTKLINYSSGIYSGIWILPEWYQGLPTRNDTQNKAEWNFVYWWHPDWVSANAQFGHHQQLGNSKGIPMGITMSLSQPPPSTTMTSPITMPPLSPMPPPPTTNIHHPQWAQHAPTLHK